MAAIAVGADRVGHLAKLVEAAWFDVNAASIAAYRGLLAQRKATVTQ